MLRPLAVLTPDQVLYRFGNGNSKTNSEKWGVVSDNWFRTGKNGRMAQKYMD